MILGIGVDTVDTVRFERKVTENPRLLERIFAPEERDMPTASLAARFAAKEAFRKACGGATVSDPHGKEISIEWNRIVVPRRVYERPEFAETDTYRAVCDALGVTSAHLSLTHDADVATAFVVLEGVR